MVLPYLSSRKSSGKLFSYVMIVVLMMGTLLPALSIKLSAQEMSTPIAPVDEPLRTENPTTLPTSTELSEEGIDLPPPDQSLIDDSEPLQLDLRAPDGEMTAEEESTPDPTNVADGDVDDATDIVPLLEDPARGTTDAPETLTTMRTSASVMLADIGSVHITNYDQFRNPLESNEFQILQAGSVIASNTTTNTGTLTIHLLPLEVDLIARQIVAPAGCDIAPEQTFQIRNGRPFQTSLIFVNDCGGSAGTISVTVENQHGMPLADVEASARYDTGYSFTNIQGWTGGSGQVTLDPVYVGFEYVVVARLLPAGCMSPPSQIVVVTDEALHHSLRFVTQCTDPATTGGLSIVKHDENNVTLSGIGFEVYSGTTLVTFGTTNEAGQFGVENIPAGPYIIRETNTPPGCIDSGDTLVDVVAGGSPTVVRIENDCSGSPGRITVRNVDQYGNPLASVTFRLEVGTRILGSWTTDAAGEATTGPLVLNQTYEIIKNTGMCSAWGIELAYLDAAEPELRVTVVSFCSEATPPPDWFKADLLLIKTDDLGNLLPGAEFDLSLDGTVIATGTTDTNGEILFPGLASDTQYSLREIAAPEGCTFDGSARLVLMPADGSDQTTYVTNTCESSLGSITVIKMDQHGTLLPGVDFEISAIGMATRTGTTNADGELLFDTLVADSRGYVIHEVAAPTGCIASGDHIIALLASDPHKTARVTNDCRDDVVPGETPTATPTEPSETPTPTSPDPGETATPALPDPEVTPTDPASTSTEEGERGDTRGNATQTTEIPDPARAGVAPETLLAVQGLPTTGVAHVGPRSLIVPVLLSVVALCLLTTGIGIVRRR